MKRPSEGGLEAVLIKRLAHYMLELSPRHRGTGFPRSIRHSCAAGLRQHGPACSPGEKSGNFDFILGDKSHLESTDLAFSGELVIGKSKQVAATAKEGKLTSLDELTGQAVTRIAIADSKMRFTVACRYRIFHLLGHLRAGAAETVGGRHGVAGAPYVVSGEVDVGFINLTEAMAIASKVGRLLSVDESLYLLILIVAKRMQQMSASQGSRYRSSSSCKRRRLGYNSMGCSDRRQQSVTKPTA
jgi:molybdate transport system substrate-binding protein